MLEGLGNYFATIMKKKTYISPRICRFPALNMNDMLGLIAPSEGITDGGEGNDDDDPTAPLRAEETEEFEWGNLW